MKKKTLAILTAVCLTSMTFATPAGADGAELSERAANKLIELNGQIQSINGELSSQRANLGSMKVELALQNDQNDAFRREMIKELKALRRQNQSLVDSIYHGGTIRGSNDITEIKPLRNYDLQTPDGKMYFGEDEYFYIKEASATLDARIDTGAAVSSIHAQNITEFERKGKKWYRFTIEANDHNIECEAPFIRTSTIRQASSEESIQRVVVALNIKIGDYSTRSEFTLTDRSSMQYPMLIGRSLIQDIAVVDVSRDHIQGRNKDTFLILSRNDYKQNVEKGIDINAEFKAKQASAEATGKVAYPSSSYGSNLGSDSENALPVVRRQAAQENAGENAPAPVAEPQKK